jgi:hypothetical protein
MSEEEERWSADRAAEAQTNEQIQKEMALEYRAKQLVRKEDEIHALKRELLLRDRLIAIHELLMDQVLEAYDRTSKASNEEMERAIKTIRLALQVSRS